MQLIGSFVPLQDCADVYLVHKASQWDSYPSHESFPRLHNFTRTFSASSRAAHISPKRFVVAPNRLMCCCFLFSAAAAAASSPGSPDTAAAPPSSPSTFEAAAPPSASSAARSASTCAFASGRFSEQKIYRGPQAASNTQPRSGMNITHQKKSQPSHDEVTSFGEKGRSY